MVFDCHVMNIIIFGTDRQMNKIDPVTHWCSQCQNMTLIYHPWRGAMMSHHFLGEGARVMTPIHHLRMSHHYDAHESCTLMLPVSKHDAHLSPMERNQWWVIIFWGRGTSNITLIYHPRMSHHPDDTKFKIWCQYSKTLNNILNQPPKCVHTEGIKQFYKNTLVYCIR